MRLLRLPEVKAELGPRSNTSIYNDIADGLCTQGVKIGPRAVAWPHDEIEAIATARVAGMHADGIRALVRHLHAERARRAEKLQALVANLVAADQV
ncbi:helix-turn-helix transcriptional regulator [Variovorax sp. LARHSF232]